MIITYWPFKLYISMNKKDRLRMALITKNIPKNI